MDNEGVPTVVAVLGEVMGQAGDDEAGSCVHMDRLSVVVRAAING
jgi:hypothetical protein